MKTIIEKERGCGYRKQGGLYFFAFNMGYPCGKLPIPLTTCPCCNAGIKFSRGFQWIKWELLKSGPCRKDNSDEGCFCPLNNPDGTKKLGLMWVGEKFYPTPADFLKEGYTQGVSKRINTVPRDFVVGETWIAVAHKKAIKNDDGTFTPGIFQMFQPTEIQYVVTGKETPEELEGFEKRGITPVDVVYEGDV